MLADNKKYNLKTIYFHDKKKKEKKKLRLEIRAEC